MPTACLSNPQLAMSESLSRELTTFNIKVIIVQPGAFATHFGDAANYPSSTAVDQKAHYSLPYKGTPIAAIFDWMATLTKGFKNADKPMGGSLEKACLRIFETVTGTGMAEGVAIGEAFRLPLGKDCVKRFDEKLENMTKNLEATKAMGLSTEY